MTTTNQLDAWLEQEQRIRLLMDAGAGPGVAQTRLPARPVWR
jgi:hypothetical protein